MPSSSIRKHAGTGAASDQPAVAECGRKNHALLACRPVIRL